jgi:RHS repeat-associated protein
MILTGISGFTSAVTNSYAHDTMNRLTLVSNSYANAQYGVDSAGRLSTKTYGNGDVTRYGYDGESRLTSLVTSNGGNSVQGWFYGYNAMGMITNQTTDGGGQTTAYGYDALYRLTYETVNGTSTVWTIDAAGNWSSKSNATSGLVNYCCNDDNEIIPMTLSSNVTGTVSPGTASNKWFNTQVAARGQQVQASTNSGAFAILNVPVYLGSNMLDVVATDVSGNRYTQTVSFTVQSSGAVSGMVYDAQGNVATNIQNGVTNAFAYDLENRLVQVTSNGVTVLQCWYDGAGRRIAKTEVLGSATNSYQYVYDGWTVLAVLNGNGQMLEYYTRGAGLAGDIGTIIAAQHFAGSFTNGAFYFHNNHRGDVTGVRSGTVTVATCDYAAYGDVRTSSGSYASRYLFSSKELDQSTALYYFGCRFYDNKVGKWTTQDPLGVDAGLNDYSFCDNSPVHLIDPFGLCPPIDTLECVKDCFTSSAAKMRKAAASEAVYHYVGGVGAAGSELYGVWLAIRKGNRFGVVLMGAGVIEYAVVAIKTSNLQAERDMEQVVYNKCVIDCLRKGRTADYNDLRVVDARNWVRTHDIATALPLGRRFDNLPPYDGEKQ